MTIKQNGNEKPTQGINGNATGNAGGNDHVIAINDQLGFEIVSVYRRWELSLAAS